MNIRAAVSTVCRSLASMPLYNPLNPFNLKRNKTHCHNLYMSSLFLFQRIKIKTIIRNISKHLFDVHVAYRRHVEINLYDYNLHLISYYNISESIILISLNI